MRKLIIFLFSVLPMLLFGQYTYFNTYMPAPNQGTAGGFCSQLFISGSNLTTLGLYNDFNNFQRTNYQLSMNGDLLGQYDFDLPNLGFCYQQLSDASRMLPNGKIISALSYEDLDYFLFPKVTCYNEDWTEDWSFEWHEYDTLEFRLSAEYHTVIQCSNGEYIAAGPLGMDTIPDEIGDTHCDFIMTRFTEEGTVVWHKRIPFHLGTYFDDPSNFLRVNDITELSNGDLLAWGAWYADWDPMVVRFDANGNFISEHHWGSPQYDDWLPWPVQVSDSTFLFAYSRGFDALNEFNVFHNPIIGLFNANQMEIEWEIEHNYVHTFGEITDFEKLDDNTFVLLGYGYPDSNNPGRAFMLAVDAQGNELWQQEYWPPQAYLTPTAMDLEITPDGGLAYAGNFFRVDENHNPIDQVTWVVKTDGCGEEVFNGCTSAVAELAIENSKLKISPNPASSVVNLSSEQEIKSITIRDVTGKIVLQQQMNNHELQTQIDVNRLATGLYLIEANFGNNRVVAQRLVKQE